MGVKSSLYLLAFLASSSVWTPSLFALYPTTAAASVAANLYALSSLSAAASDNATSAGSGSAAAPFPALVSVGPPQNGAAWAYSIFALLYVATAAACCAPEALFAGEVTPLAQLLKFTWAPGFLLAAVACLVLKSGAERGRLGGGTFKRLNAGLAALEIVYSAVFGAAVASGGAVDAATAAPNLVGSVAIAVFCSFKLVTAKK